MQRNTIFLACFFVCNTIAAQQYSFVHYTPKDGLVNSRVRKAYQDSKGRMYFMTFGGLSVYDGARFKNYTTQNGLIADMVNDVLEVGDDSLLVAVNSCGLNVLVRGKMKRSEISTSHCPVVNQLLKSKDGNIYMSADNGLYKMGKTSLEKLSAFFPQQKNPIDFLGAIAEYKDFLVFTTNDIKNFTGLFLYSKKAGKITDALMQLTVQDLRSDHSGIIWVGTSYAMQNLDTLALAAGKLELRKPYASFVNQEALATGNINFNGENEPLIASAGKGIIRYSKESAPLHIVSPDFPASAVYNFFSDREDVLWICHDGNGVYKLSNTKFYFTGIFSRKNKSGIYAVRAFTPDSLWIVMKNRQWILQTPSKIKSFSISPLMAAIPLQSNQAYLYAVNLSDLYMAALPKSNETIIRFKKIMTLRDTSNFGDECVIDPYGNIILFENRNICVIQNEKQIFTYPISTYDLIEGMHIDNQKLLWVTSRSNGLMIFSLHPEDPLHYLQKQSQFIKDFETASPRCMAMDKNETHWVGTRHQGLMAFEYKNNQLRKLYHFQTQNGLTDNFVTSLACDDNDNVIIGTQTGIDRLVKNKDGSYRLENISKSNNIFAYINYVWTDAENNAFAITSTGNVLRVEPVLPAKAVFEPQLLIEEMKVDGKPISQTVFPPGLKYYQRNISFSVAAPTFIDERQVQYSYLLSGSGNNQWSDTTSIADINLLNLSPGNYTLRVKAFFSSTTYRPKEMEFHFKIFSPWWQTWWFRLIAALLIIALLIIGFRFYYRRKLEKQKAILEKQQAIEKERTRIATDMHDDLGAGLSRIKFLSETIGIKKQQEQPIEEEISKIRDYSHQMIDKMGEIVWALNERNDSLNDLIAYTRAYAMEYLSQNGIECKMEMPVDPDVFFVSGEFRRNIFLSVKEILHNIVKHACANKVVIVIQSGKELVIEIKDDGIGFDLSAIRPFSNGLWNINNRMKEIGGVAEIKNDDGTCFILSAPLQ